MMLGVAMQFVAEGDGTPSVAGHGGFKTGGRVCFVRRVVLAVIISIA